MNSIILLVGPKGAGKSTIGEILEKRRGIQYVQAEQIFLKLRNEIGSNHPDLEVKGYEALIVALEDALRRGHVVCFDSTGASSRFPDVVSSVSALGRVIAIKVTAPNEVLLE